MPIEATTPSRSESKMVRFSPQEASGSAEDQLLELNRVPSEYEITSIRALITRDEEEIAVMEKCIGRRREEVSSSEKMVKAIEGSILSTEAISRIVEKRMNSNIAIEKEAATTLRSLTSKVKRAGISPAITEFKSLVAALTSELETVRAAVQEDVGRLGVTTSNIRSLEQKLVEAKSKNNLESEAMSVLENCRDGLLAGIKSKRQLISTGRRLPNEIMAMIFIQFVEMEIETIIKDRNAGKGYAVIVLSSICKRWRRIVAGTPSLWKYIPLPSPLCRNSPARVEDILQGYFSNALKHRSLIVDCTFGGPWPKGGDQRELTYDVLTLLTSNITSRPRIRGELFDRAKSIELIGRDSNSMSMDCPWECKSYILHRIQPSFTHNVKDQLINLTIHINTLTALAVQELLRTLPNLSRFELSVEAGKFSGQHDNNPIHVTHLRHLIVDVPLLPSLLRFITTAPALTRLQVKVHPAGGALDLEDPKLSLTQHVAFENYCAYSWTSQFKSMLKHLTRAQKVEFCGPYLHKMIAWSSADLTYLSSMNELVLRDSDIKSPSIVEFIEKRKGKDEGGGLTPLKKLVLDSCDGITRSECDELKAIVDELVILG